MAPIPQDGFDAPMQRQPICDEIDLARWSEALYAIEEMQPRGGVARGSQLNEDVSCSEHQRARYAH